MTKPIDMNTPYSDFLISELRTTTWEGPAAYFDIPHITNILNIGIKTVGIPMMQEISHSLLTLEQHHLLVHHIFPGHPWQPSAIYLFPPHTPTPYVRAYMQMRPSLDATRYRLQGLIPMIAAIRSRKCCDYTDTSLTAWIWATIFPHDPLQGASLARLLSYLRITETPASFMRSPLQPIFESLQHPDATESHILDTLRRFKPFLIKT